MFSLTDENDNSSKAIHDINSSLSALQGAVEVIQDEWRTNPELVDKILPLTIEKISQLQTQLVNFRKIETKLPSSKK